MASGLLESDTTSQALEESKVDVHRMEILQALPYHVASGPMNRLLHRTPEDINPDGDRRFLLKFITK